MKLFQNSNSQSFSAQQYNLLCIHTLIFVICCFKDGVLSAFEHHCAESYNLPFTGFILIPIGVDLLHITTKHYPMRKKFVNWNFERDS